MEINNDNLINHDFEFSDFNDDYVIPNGDETRIKFFAEPNNRIDEPGFYFTRNDGEIVIGNKIKDMERLVEICNLLFDSNIQLNSCSTLPIKGVDITELGHMDNNGIFHFDK